MHQAIHIARAGLYDEVRIGPALTPALHYLELFPVLSTGQAARAGAIFEDRRQDHPEAALNLVLTRIGRLAPDPGGMAIWTVQNYVALEPLARSAADARLDVTAAGAYRPFGEEIV